MVELNEFLDEERILEEATAKAAKRALARKMKTSRTQLDRRLDPGNQSVTQKR